jgi:hypothetical protein
MPSNPESRTNLLKGLLAFSILSTGIHYTHNFFEIDKYPSTFVPGWVVQAAILVFWPVLTFAGIRGYRLYRRGRLRDAHELLAIYSLTGLTTPLHFLSGNPDIPPVFYVTIFTDGIAGLSILGFVLASMSSMRRETRTPAPAD